MCGYSSTSPSASPAAASYTVTCGAALVMSGPLTARVGRRHTAREAHLHLPGAGALEPVLGGVKRVHVHLGQPLHPLQLAGPRRSGLRATVARGGLRARAVTAGGARTHEPRGRGRRACRRASRCLRRRARDGRCGRRAAMLAVLARSLGYSSCETWRTHRTAARRTSRCGRSRRGRARAPHPPSRRWRPLLSSTTSWRGARGEQRSGVTPAPGAARAGRRRPSAACARTRRARRCAAAHDVARTSPDAPACASGCLPSVERNLRRRATGADLTLC